MSRRKQAKPRLWKREEEEDDDENLEQLNINSTYENSSLNCKEEASDLEDEDRIPFVAVSAQPKTENVGLESVALNDFAVAIDDGWLLLSSLGISINHLEELPLTDEQFVLSYKLDKYLGRISGAVMAAILLDRVGRKSLLSICAITFCLTWSLLLFGKSVWIFYLARIAFGMATGIHELTNAVYLGENSSPSNRGVFGAIIVTIYSFGLLIGISSARFFHFRVGALINFAITLLSLMSVFWMVEPVQYLLIKGEIPQAKENFAWLRGIANSEEMNEEFEKIKQNVNAETSKKSSYIKIFTYPANYKSLVTMLIISLLIGLLDYYSGDCHLFFAFSGKWDSFLILSGAVIFLFMASTPFIIRRFNRISVTVILFLVISITFLLIAALNIIDSSNNFLFICKVIIILFLSSIDMFAYAILFLLRSELFPLSVKGIGGLVSFIGFNFGTWLMIEIFESTIINPNFFYYFSSSSVGLILIIFLYYINLPETGNNSLIEIQEKLEGGSQRWNVSDFNRFSSPDCNNQTSDN